MFAVKIHEVGLRDGLQMEKQIIPTDKKIQWAKELMKAGLPIIQIGSFVHPVKVPQMADTDEIFEYFKNEEHSSTLSGLILNEKGLERADKCGVEMYCLGVSASETHSQKNTRMSTDEALERIIKMAIDVQKDKKQVQVSVQSAFGCGFGGKIDEEKVLNMVTKYIENGLLNISLADTAGHAYPEQVKRIIRKIKSKHSEAKIAIHIHNTYGLGIANCYAGIEAGADIIETAFGGLGGCPFTKQAAGNVCTEDFVHALQRNDILKHINLEKIIHVTKDTSELLEKPLEGYVYKAGQIQY